MRKKTAKRRVQWKRQQKQKIEESRTSPEQHFIFSRKEGNFRRQITEIMDEKRRKAIVFIFIAVHNSARVEFIACFLEVSLGPTYSKQFFAHFILSSNFLYLRNFSSSFLLKQNKLFTFRPFCRWVKKIENNKISTIIFWLKLSQPWTNVLNLSSKGNEKEVSNLSEIFQLMFALQQASGLE